MTTPRRVMQNCRCTVLPDGKVGLAGRDTPIFDALYAERFPLRWSVGVLYLEDDHTKGQWDA